MFRRKEGVCFLFLATCWGSHLLTYTPFFVMMKIFSILKLFQTYVCVCERACASNAVYVEGRPVGVSPLAAPCGPGTECRWSHSVEMPLPLIQGRPEHVHIVLKITKHLGLFFLKFIFSEFQAIRKHFCCVFSSASPSVLLYLLVLCLTEHRAHWFA